MPRYRDWDRDLDQEYSRIRVRKAQNARRSHQAFDDEDRDQREFFRQNSRKPNDHQRRSNRD